MIFNTIEFIVFFALFCACYYSVLKEKTKSQNILLLVASYVFYAYANWKILPLLIISTLVFYGLGIAVSNAENQKKKSWLSTLGVVFGIGVLLYFKYTNFFITSFKELFESIGLQTNWHTFNIIVPIGISFYTFRLLSYVIDINRGKYEPTKDIIAFSAYVAFFPCILSGPIDRPNTLIPQLQTKRVFDYGLAVDGCRQILWGLFKKIVIADNAVIYINQAFDPYQEQSGSTLLIGAILFTFQMYADFSGYSDMAIGVAKLLGFKVTQNFNYPLFAQNISDFWRRWHISLTSWLTDYVFMPLNVKWRDLGKWGMILAIVVDFVICGLWHGANWTFVLWGVYHGLLFIPLILSGTMFKKAKIKTYTNGFPTIKTGSRMLLTFLLVALGLILFRSENINNAYMYISNICSPSLFTFPVILKEARLLLVILLIFLSVIIEWFSRNDQYALEKLGLQWKSPLRYAMYYGIIFLIFLFAGGEQQFIYFQF
jgi:D-alanyl-lipoteichoic acid acyltransferase DltB (MBOAT superfamily)